MEGSLRVPFLIRWPGQIPAGQKSNEIVHIVDLLPTLAGAAGLEMPKDRIIDGVDQLEFLTGKNKFSAREGFPAYNGDDMFAYKWRDWKLHLIEQRSALDPPKRLNVPQIYNLITDPKEEYDLVPRGKTASWTFPPIFWQIVAFQQTLTQEPPIPFGAPEPWDP